MRYLRLSFSNRCSSCIQNVHVWPNFRLMYHEMHFAKMLQNSLSYFPFNLALLKNMIKCISIKIKIISKLCLLNIERNLIINVLPVINH